MSSNVLDGNKVFEQHLALDGKSALNETSAEFDARHARAINLIVQKNETSVSGGVVVLEGSPVSSYAEAWIELGSITVSNGKGLQTININENDDGMPCPFVRARIKTAISNGTIDAHIVTQG